MVIGERAMNFVAVTFIDLNKYMWLVWDSRRPPYVLQPCTLAFTIWVRCAGSISIIVKCWKHYTTCTLVKLFKHALLDKNSKEWYLNVFCCGCYRLILSTLRSMAICQFLIDLSNLWSKLEKLLYRFLSKNLCFSLNFVVLNQYTIRDAI